MFNFWEPLHFFHKGYGFQTWEVSPQFAIRSWAYIVLHAMPVKVASFLFPTEKVSTFDLYSSLYTHEYHSGLRSSPSASPSPSSQPSAKPSSTAQFWRISMIELAGICSSSYCSAPECGTHLQVGFARPGRIRETDCNCASVFAFVIRHVYHHAGVLLRHRPCELEEQQADPVWHPAVCNWRHSRLAIRTGFSCALRGGRAVPGWRGSAHVAEPKQLVPKALAETRHRWLRCGVAFCTFLQDILPNHV